MDYLDPFGIWIGIILAIPVFWTWYQVVWGAKKQKQDWLKQIRKTPGERPAVLIVNMQPEKDIANFVKRFMQSDSNLKEIPEERIFELVWDKPLMPDNMLDFSEQLRKKIAEIYRCGPDKLHYFHAGPTTAAACVGAELKNSMQVFLYQYTQGQYQNFGPLRVHI